MARRVQAILIVQEVDDRGEPLWQVRSTGETGVYGPDFMAMAKSAVGNASAVVAVSIEAEAQRRAERR